MSHRWTLQIDSLLVSGLKISFFEVASDKVPQENIQWHFVFTKPTESQLNTIIIHKIKWFNNNICPSGSLIIQFMQWKIQPDQFLKILIQPVTKCVIKVSQSVVNVTPPFEFIWPFGPPRHILEIKLGYFISENIIFRANSE